MATNAFSSMNRPLSRPNSALRTALINRWANVGPRSPNLWVISNPFHQRVSACRVDWAATRA